jgi:hypothetical protein
LLTPKEKPAAKELLDGANISGAEVVKRPTSSGASRSS